MPAAIRGALFLGGASAAISTALEHRLCDSLRFTANHVTDDRIPVNCFGQLTGQRVHGGRGRIRTSVARKERQIYSLLVLATHPPVLEKSAKLQTLVPKKLTGKIQRSERKHKTDSCQETPARRFAFQDSLCSIPHELS